MEPNRPEHTNPKRQREGTEQNRQGEETDLTRQDQDDASLSLALRATVGEPIHPVAAWLGPDERPLPVFVRLSDLNDHIRATRTQAGAPTLAHQADWLPHFLANDCRAACPDADEAFFRAALEQGRAAVLLDGLDEAPSETDRRTLVRLIQAAADAYGQCRFVVTSRPTAVQGQSVLPGFATVGIAPLEMEAVEVFLGRWCQALFPEDAARADEHLSGLLRALRSRAEIRRLARNPVMLTALAVVHWNEKRLPEQRADLYESIIKWLAQSRERENRPGRVMAERCVGLLQNLALAMQDHTSGCQESTGPVRIGEERTVGFSWWSSRSAVITCRHGGA